MRVNLHFSCTDEKVYPSFTGAPGAAAELDIIMNYNKRTASLPCHPLHQLTKQQPDTPCDRPARLCGQVDTAKLIRVEKWENIQCTKQFEIKPTGVALGFSLVKLSISLYLNPSRFMQCS